MCYPKPGPRCSPHAFKALSSARTEMRRVMHIRRNGYDRHEAGAERYVAAKANYEAAQWEYYKTPGGQLYIDKRLLCGTDDFGQTLTEMDRIHLEESKKRAWDERLSDLKNLRKGQSGLTVAEIRHEYGDRGSVSMQLLPDGEDRMGWSRCEDEITAAQEVYHEQSIEWASQLSDSERNDLLHWTDNGYQSVNTFLATGQLPEKRSSKPYDTWQELSQREEMSAFVGRMDTMLERGTPGGKSMVVYRGAANYVLPQEVQQKIKDSYDVSEDGNLEMVEESVTSKFQPGKVFNMPIFQSASSNPEVATQFVDSGLVIFEIKTSRANPVGSFSRYDDQEAEMLLPRNMKMKVVGVQKRVRFVRSYHSGFLQTDEKEYTVVQFEDCE